ncbi:hypothetical protein [Pseudobutyrivibrio sp. LB2011]|uniref:hypothetical protein n=1 Tax=Pseudobutyrivibrio sp. LB2011 TaxID=1408312 RepID=UPI0005D28FBE|nr:hypothetical protein [Pseudobutyrivibrio sp. LB2011]
MTTIFFILCIILSLVLLYFCLVFLIQVPRALMDIDTRLNQIAKILQKNYERDYNEKINAVARKLNALELESEEDKQ